MKNQLSALFLSLFILGISLLGCKSDKFKKQVKEIGQLQTQVEDIRLQAEALDSAAVVSMRDSVTQTIAAIQNHFEEPIDKKTAVTISRYAMISSKTLNNFEMEYFTLLREIKYTKNQLETLKTDLDKNALEIEAAKDYVEQEKRAVASLQTVLEELNKKVDFSRKRVKKLNPEIQEIVNKVKPVR